MSKTQASGALSQQLSGLVAVIAEANFPGSLEGLFAFHILETEATFPLSWDVSNARPTWLEEHKQELDHFPVIAALGYSLYHWHQTATKTVREAFRSGVSKLEQRELFPDDGYSFINIPITFLGVVLGSSVVFPDKEREETLAWLRSALRLKQQKGIPNVYRKLVYIYASTLLSGAPVAVNEEECTRLEELALLEWGQRQGVFRLSGVYQDVYKVHNLLLMTALTVPMSQIGADKAAVIWSALHSSLTNQLQAETHTAQPTRLNVEAGLRQVRTEIAALPADVRTEFATLEARLLSLLDEEDHFGINEALRSERVRVLDALNKFCMNHLNWTFNQCCSYEGG